jgi:hypothetical protein
VTPAEARRLALAEEVCWSLALAMHLDILNRQRIPRYAREFIATPLLAWMNETEEVNP